MRQAVLFAALLGTALLTGCSEAGMGGDDDTGGEADASSTPDGPVSSGPDAAVVPAADAASTPDAAPLPDADFTCADFGAPSAVRGVSSFVPYGVGSGDFTLASWRQIGGGANKSIPNAGDLDGDGVPDVLLNPRVTDDVIVLRGNGDGSFAPPIALDAPGLFPGGWGNDFGDIDGDGDWDLVIGDHVLGTHAWINNGSMSFARAVSGLPAGDMSGAGFADLSGDGNLDVMLGADQFGRGYAVAFGDGAGNWTPQAIAGGMPPWEAVADGATATNIGYFVFADYDGDDDLDVFAFGGVASRDGVTCFVYRNEGDGRTFTPIQEIVGGGEAFGVGSPVMGSVADVNEDGRLDVAAGGAVYHGRSDGTWELGWALDSTDLSHFADMNGDCHLDLVTHSSSTGLKLWLGDGTGAYILADVDLPGGADVPAGFGSIDNAYGIDIADLDGNGRLDIARVYKTTTGATLFEAWVR